VKVKTVRNEIIDLDLIKIYSLENEILVIKDEDKIKKYTLTEESRKRLAEYLKTVE